MTTEEFSTQGMHIVKLIRKKEIELKALESRFQALKDEYITSNNLLPEAFIYLLSGFYEKNKK